MDTVSEDNSPSSAISVPQKDICLIPNLSMINETEESENDDDHESASSSRRPSAIIAALRRPSQTIALSAAHAVIAQKRYFASLLHGGQGERSTSDKECPKSQLLRKQNRKLGDDALTTILSALYAKLLVVLGMAFPITEIISKDVQPFFYQGFYLYLYLGSISFVAYMYVSFVREKTVNNIINSYNKEKNEKHLGFFGHHLSMSLHNKPHKFGSFYLRLGAIAFGIGSMVHSGLEFGQYFELKNNAHCSSNILQAITPATRMLLTMVQVQFIFLNTKDIDLDRHKIIARFGLMHMVATNLCEWLYVIVEETKHEITHLGEHEHNHTATNASTHETHCEAGQVMGSLVSNASPFLFPCTIEYSLICAVILFEMWKKVKPIEFKKEEDTKESKRYKDDKVKTHYSFNPFGGNPVNSNHHFSVDCSNAHKGLFAGIMIVVLTIISLIIFFVLANKPSGSEEENIALRSMAEMEVNIMELALYILTTVVVITAMLQLRQLKYDRKMGEGRGGLGLDNTLLVVAQTGMFIYCMFSVIGSCFSMSKNSTTGLMAEILSFIQTCLQTMFVLDGWWRRCRTLDQVKSKPGKELITFLIIANMAMWSINALEKNRAEFRPDHLKFFGKWAWTIITHISMPLAIFYRFHSTICLFEIWKTAYKLKAQYKNPVFPIISHPPS